MQSSAKKPRIRRIDREPAASFRRRGEYVRRFD
jgi:hypothetical protein